MGKYFQHTRLLRRVFKIFYEGQLEDAYNSFKLSQRAAGESKHTGITEPQSVDYGKSCKQRMNNLSLDSIFGSRHVGNYSNLEKQHVQIYSVNSNLSLSSCLDFNALYYRKV